MTWLVLGTIVGPSAQAQSFTDMGQVMGPDGSVSFASRSVGSPSVTWDYLHDQMIMVFESRTPTTHANCGKGVWGIGMATSPDGKTWTIQSTSVVMPSPSTGNGYACVAAHPTAVFTNAGPNGRVQVYWKAESWTTCATAFCEYTGIGRATINLDGSGNLNTVDIQTGPVIQFPTGRYGGYPRIVRLDSTFHLAVQLYPNIHTFTSNTASAFLVSTGRLPFDPTDAAWNSYGWITDEFMSPAMICDGSDFELFVGSKDTDFGVTQSGALGLAVSSNYVSWFLNSVPWVTWSGDDTYRHFDAVKLVSGDYLLYYSEKDQSGDSTIHLAATDTGFDLVNGLATYEPIGKVCTSP